MHFYELSNLHQSRMLGEGGMEMKAQVQDDVLKTFTTPKRKSGFRV